MVLLILFSLPVYGEIYDEGLQKKKTDLCLSFTGDMMAHVINYSMTDYSLIYKDIEHIIQNDSLTFCNVEFPVNIDLPQASFPVFNIHPEYVCAGINAGIDALSIANNHIADQGTRGIIATVNSFRKIVKDYGRKGRDIYFTGACDTPLNKPEIITIYKNGWKIGFAAVSQLSNRDLKDSYMFILDPFDTEQTNGFVDWINAESKDYDLFILSFHGGIEYQAEPCKIKMELFDRLIRSGVDIIWSHHPHVIQPVDIVRIDGRDKVIMNSMGNFISGQGRIADPSLPEEEWSYTGDSAIVQIKLSHDRKGPVLEDLDAIPIANIMNTNRDVVICPIEELTHRAIPEPWKSFFIERFILMHDYFTRNIRYRE